MILIDLLIGFTLMNAMPHYVLGIWKVKMPSGFGLGNLNNILWGIANLLLSVVLFIYKYGFEGFETQQIYTGALVLLIIFWFTCPFWYRFYYKK